MEKLFDLVLKQDGDVLLEETYEGELLISPCTGGHFEGTFEGKPFNGVAMPVGAGITKTPQPGHNDIYAPTLLKTDDGTIILMEMHCIFDIDPDEESLLEQGITVDSSNYYYKGTVSFRTGNEKYKKLERRIFVAECIIENWESMTFSVYLV